MDVEKTSSDFKKLLEQVKDPYDRKARLLPGLWVIAPILVALGVRFGLKHPILSIVVTILGACGGMYGLTNIVRGKGKELEEKLVKKWGGMPTTIALRHRDTFLDSVSKQRYHELITRKFGVQMPTAEQELAYPEKADDAYIGATKRLRELTRNDKALLFKENIAYGFHRNTLAMKPLGIMLCAISLVFGLLQGGILMLHTPYMDIGALENLDVAAGIILTIAIVFLFAWLLYFTPAAVRRIGFVYAERLFERLPSLKVVGAAKAANE